MDRQILPDDRKNGLGKAALGTPTDNGANQPPMYGPGGTVPCYGPGGPGGPGGPMGPGPNMVASKQAQPVQVLYLCKRY
jgi:hypothetical protein